MPGSSQAARVAIANERWIEFRQAALVRRLSVAAYLGLLVEAELGRRARRPVAAVDPAEAPAEQLVAALAEVRASIDELDAIAGRLARTAISHGVSWSDVASSPRLSNAAARAAYEQR